ncbi:MAG TPA: hypothetical protein GX699_01100 [Firmicutes bacterium]|nr:hypothetical protein [Bacillota bacterium]
MAVTVGIPRALLYYQYYPAWEAFFRTLGAETVLSAETSKSILDQGVRLAVEEACLPVKLFLGHVADLRDQGVDMLFIPRIVSVEAKKYHCPKFLGLPEIVRSSVPGLPEILTAEINIARKPARTGRELRRLAARFDRRPWVIDRALAAAAKAHAGYQSLLQSGCTPQEALQGSGPAHGTGKIRVAVLGHVYNVNDRYSSHNLLARLRELEVDVITADMLPKEAVKSGSKRLQKESFWSFGHELLGAGCFLLQEKSVRGVVLVGAFGCGPDSLICEMLARYYRRYSTIPVLLLTLDEHTGEAGLVTRLEAFVDMLRRREAR